MSLDFDSKVLELIHSAIEDENRKHYLRGYAECAEALNRKTDDDYKRGFIEAYKGVKEIINIIDTMKNQEESQR